MVQLNSKYALQSCKMLNCSIIEWRRNSRKKYTLEICWNYSSHTEILNFNTGNNGNLKVFTGNTGNNHANLTF